MRRAAALLLPLLLFCARSASSELCASSAPLQVATPTDFVPAGGAFTATALLRVDGYAPIPERMEWRNGMALCCGSGYYDGFRLLFHDESEFRPVFEIGRPQGAVALEASSGISTGVWHHVQSPGSLRPRPRQTARQGFGSMVRSPPFPRRTSPRPSSAANR